MTYPDVCIIPISAVVQNLMNQYQPWRQLNKKIEQASENSKCGKSQRLFIFLYKASHSSLMHQKTCNRAGTPMSRHQSDIPDVIQIIQKLQQRMAVRSFCSETCFNCGHNAHTWRTHHGQCSKVKGTTRRMMLLLCICSGQLLAWTTHADGCTHTQTLHLKCRQSLTTAGEKKSQP